MPKLINKKTAFIIELSKQEADWLKNYLQNYTGEEIEEEFDIDMRRSLFEFLVEETNNS